MKRRQAWALRLQYGNNLYIQATNQPQNALQLRREEKKETLCGLDSKTVNKVQLETLTGFKHRSATRLHTSVDEAPNPTRSRMTTEHKNMCERQPMTGRGATSPTSALGKSACIDDDVPRRKPPAKPMADAASCG